MKWFPLVLALCSLFLHCSQYDEYKKYAPDGEKIYLQRAYSVKTYPGKNRIQLEWVLVDPKVTSCKVFYEQGGIQGDVSVAIPPFGHRDSDTIRVTIPNLEETAYSFQIVSYDNNGNTSIPVEAEEQAYGQSYEQSLLNCFAKNTSYNFDGNTLTIEWGTVDAAMIGVQLNYTDTNGDSQIRLIDPLEGSTILSDFKLGEPLSCSTLYKPVPAAIDVFSADWQRIFIEITMNVVLNKPVTVSESATPAYTGEHAVDGDKTSTASRWISGSPSSPQWLEVDLQGSYTISGFGMWRDAGSIAGSQNFRLQAWIADEWVDVVSENSNVQTVYSANFSPVTTEKVRLYLTPTATVDYMIRLFEIEVYSVVRY